MCGFILADVTFAAFQRWHASCKTRQSKASSAFSRCSFNYCFTLGGQVMLLPSCFSPALLLSVPLLSSTPSFSCLFRCARWRIVESRQIMNTVRHHFLYFYFSGKLQHIWVSIFLKGGSWCNWNLCSRATTVVDSWESRNVVSSLCGQATTTA